MEQRTDDTPKAMQDEIELIHSILDGNTALFRQLADRYAGQVLRMVARLIPSSEEAEEATQDTLLEAFQSLHRFDARKASFSTWLMRIAYQRGVPSPRARTRCGSCVFLPLPQAALRAFCSLRS